MTNLPKTRDFMDRLARQVADSEGLRAPISDYRLAGILKVTRATSSSWRTGRTAFSDETALKIAELLGEDPQYVLACIHAERAHNVAVKNAWGKIAASATGIMLALALGMLLPTNGQSMDLGDRNIHYAQRRRRLVLA